jgi:hypothetical protein
MTLQTAAQQKAQTEIDDVIGTDRLPTLADRARLPYFEALFTEVLRMYTFIPISKFFFVPSSFIFPTSILWTELIVFFHKSQTCHSVKKTSMMGISSPKAR